MNTAKKTAQIDEIEYIMQSFLRIEKMANLFEFEGEEYEWEETEDGELRILCSGEREATQVVRALTEKGELEHGDYLARAAIELPERMDGSRWIIFQHGSDCRCPVNMQNHWHNWADENRGKYVYNTGNELTIITREEAEEKHFENCDTVEAFAEQRINEDAWPFDYKYADLM